MPWVWVRASIELLALFYPISSYMSETSLLEVPQASNISPPSGTILTGGNRTIMTKTLLIVTLRNTKPPQNRTMASAVTGRRITAYAMAPG